MLKKYIQDIVKHETRKILLSNYKEKLVYEIKQKKELEEENRRIKSRLSNNIYYNLYQKQIERTELLVKEKDKEIEELKVLYEQEKNKNYKTLESEELKRENQKLKESIENLEVKLILKDNLLSEQKEENKHLKNTLKLSSNEILELKDLYEQEKNKN